MSPEEVSQKLGDFAKKLAESVPTITQSLAKNAKAKIQDRIQERGLNEELTSFPDYSPAYKKYKSEKQGPEAASKRNLTLTGNMWRQTDIKAAGLNGKNYEVIIGGTTNDSQDKINWNAEQIGDFMDLSKKEKDELDEDYNSEIDKLIAESGLG